MIEERRAFFCRRDRFHRMAEPDGASASRIPLHHPGYGLGGISDAGVEPCTIRYQNAGFAVLLVDYRYFGKRREYRGKEKGKKLSLTNSLAFPGFFGFGIRKEY